MVPMQRKTRPCSVAEMTNVRHADLLEKVTGYMKHLTNGKFRSLDFFIPHTYQDSTGRMLPCYLLTQKDCNMVANKMTREKGGIHPGLTKDSACYMV